MAVGRISGPLLQQNLFRDNVPLAFYNTSSQTENPTLYLDVTDGFVGIQTSTPQYQLDVSGNINATNLRVIPGTSQLGNILFNSNTVATSVGGITIQPTGGNLITLKSAVTATGISTFGAGVESYSTVTGSVLVTGGQGITGNLYVGGLGSFNTLTAKTETLTGDINATSSTNGTLIVTGGLGISRDVYVGGTIYGNISTASIANFYFTATTLAISNTQTSGLYYPMLANTSSGYVYIKGSNSLSYNATTNLLSSPNAVFNSTTITNLLFVSGNTDATSTNTGALVVQGGVGIGGTLWSSEHYIFHDTSNQAYPGGYDAGLYIRNTYAPITGITIEEVTGHKLMMINNGGTFYLTQALSPWPIGTDPFTNTPMLVATSSTTSVPLTTASTSTQTGAFVVTGGVGIGKDLNVGGTITAKGNIIANGNIILGSNTTTDTLTIDAEIASNLVPAKDNTYSIGTASNTWATGYVNTLYSNIISNQSGQISINPADSLLNINASIRVNGDKPIGTAPVVTNLLYVTMDGDDTNDGRAQDASRACRTIGGALNSPYYGPGTSIRVAPGHYFENNPLLLQPYTSIIGQDLRTTSIEPINKTQDLFHLQSGCYLAQMQFLNGRSGVLPGSYASGYNRGAYATAYPPEVDGSLIDVYHSPYIQNCTNQSGPWLYDGTLFVPNQTIQIPQVLGTGTWASSSTSITVVTTGTIVVGMSINGGHQDPGYFNARTLLLANQQFIQEQVVAYVNQTYPTFVYNQALCFRDVGIIVQNIAYDATFGGNQKSVESGLAYWNGVTSVVAGEITQTIAAINYINTLSQLIINNTTATNRLGSSSTYSQIINTALTGGSISGPNLSTNIGTITTIIANGPTSAPTEYVSAAVDSSYLSAEVLLQLNRNFIQNDTLAWIANTYPSFVYNTDTCFRDVGLIIDAISQDILIGGNSKTIEAALSYWNGGYSQIVGQVTTTTQAISYAASVALNVITNTAVTPQVGNASTQTINTYFSGGGVATQSVNRNFNIINSIIINGPGVAPPTFQGYSVFAPTGITGDDIKVAPKVTAVSTISSNTYNVTINEPTVTSSTNAALYFGYTAVFPVQDTSVPDIWAQRRVDPNGSMGGSLVDGSVVSKRSPIQSFVYDAYTQVNQGGRGIHIINNGYAQLVSVFTIFCSTAVEVDTGGIASITNSNSNFGTYCLVAKSYGSREFSGTVYNPSYPGFVQNGEYYPTGYFPNNGSVLIFVPDTSNRPHIAQLMEIIPPLGYINNQGLPGFVGGQINTGTLTTGSITISGIDVSSVGIGQTVYVRDQYGNSSKNGVPYVATGTIVSDVGFQTITLNQAIVTGGGDATNPNYFTVYTCGNAYYTVLSSTAYPNPVPVGQSMIPQIQGNEIIALNFISTLTQAVVSNITGTYYSTQTQTIVPTVTGGSGSKSFIAGFFNTITNIVANGVNTTIPLVTSGTIPSGAGSAITLIQDNIEYITQETVGYISTLHPNNPNYSRTTCARDIGLILNAITQDLLFGGTSQSTFAGLQYWSQNTNTNAIIPGEATTTTAAINYLSSLSQRIVQNITTGTRYQSTVSQVTNAYTGTIAEANTLAADFSVITNILTNGTAGVTDQIVPNGPVGLLQLFTVQYAFNLLEANKTYLQAEVNAYIRATNPGFVYDSVTCARDVGYIIDCVGFDLLYGGNRQAIQAGVYYYGYSLTVPSISNETTATIAAYNYLSQLIPYVVKGITTATVQTSVPQVIPYATATNAQVTVLQQEINTITNIILNGPSVAGPKVPIGLTATNNTLLLNAANAIIQNTAFLKAELVAYIDSFFDLGSYQAKCARDVRLILQQLIYDLENGGNYNAVYSGLSYWSRAGTYHLVNLEENVTDPTLFLDGCTANFYQRSYISASGYTFEYVGAGTNYGSLPQVGVADPKQDQEVVMLDGGKVFYTSTDQNGDFRIGSELVISQATGVLSGRTFTKSLFANLTPFILAIEQG
jgi:hypothetical protein